MPFFVTGVTKLDESRLLFTTNFTGRAKRFASLRKPVAVTQDAEVRVVDSLLDLKVTARGAYILVRWEGGGKPSWELEERLPTTEVQEFHNRRRTAQPPPNPRPRSEGEGIRVWPPVPVTADDMRASAARTEARCYPRNYSQRPSPGELREDANLYTILRQLNVPRDWITNGSCPPAHVQSWLSFNSQYLENTSFFVRERIRENVRIAILKKDPSALGPVAPVHPAVVSRKRKRVDAATPASKRKKTRTRKSDTAKRTSAKAQKSNGTKKTSRKTSKQKIDQTPITLGPDSTREEVAAVALQYFQGGPNEETLEFMEEVAYALLPLGFHIEMKRGTKASTQLNWLLHPPDSWPMFRGLKLSRIKVVASYLNAIITGWNG